MIAIDGNRFRRGRFAWFLEMIADAARHRGTVRILDIGGTVQHWRAMEDLWKDYTVDITVVNLDAEITDEVRCIKDPAMRAICRSIPI